MDKGRLHFSTFSFSMQDLLLDSILSAYCLTLVKIKGREVSWHSSDLLGPLFQEAYLRHGIFKKKLKHHNCCLILLKSHAAKQNMRLGITPGIMSERISYERDRVPSNTSMWRHWLCCC